MNRTALFAALLLAVACKLPPKPKAEGGKGASALKVAPVSIDDRVLREARAAKSSFLEARPDCAVLKRDLAAALAQVDEAQPNIKTQAGQAALEAMKREMRDAVADCSS